jgi:hypothetical protein
MPLEMQLLQAYCRIARRIMLRYMTVNSCIAATKVNCLCLRKLGFEANPLPTKMLFTLPRLQILFALGLSAEELATARESRQIFPPGWNGHLVTLVDRTLLVDAALDQAAVALPITLEPEVYVFPVRNAEAPFHAEYEVHMDDGEVAKIEYVTTTDTGYETTEAWNDDNLERIAAVILKELFDTGTRELRCCPQ